VVALIGALVFVIFFLIFTLVSAFVYPSLPPAEMTLSWFGITEATDIQYGVWIVGLINGVVYGFTIWLAFSLVNLAVKRQKKEKEKEAKFANCPKCKNIIVARKTWTMMGRPDKMGQRLQMEIGLFDCPHCNITFRRILSKKKV